MEAKQWVMSDDELLCGNTKEIFRFFFFETLPMFLMSLTSPANLIKLYSIFIILKVVPMIWQSTILAITIIILRDVVQVSFFFSLKVWSYLLVHTSPQFSYRMRSDWSQQQPHENPLNQKLCNCLLIWFADFCSFHDVPHAQLCAKQVMRLIPSIIILSSRTAIIVCDWID